MQARRSQKKKSDATADIRTIFVEEEKGHRCVICKYVVLCLSFLTRISMLMLIYHRKNHCLKTLFQGNVTSCRTHIARYVLLPALVVDYVDRRCLVAMLITL